MPVRTRFCRGTPPPAAWTWIPEAIAHWKFPEIHCTGEISEDTLVSQPIYHVIIWGGFFLNMYLVKYNSAWHLQVFTCICTCTTQRTDSVTSFTCNKSWYTLLKYTLTTHTRLVQEQTLMVFFFIYFLFLMRHGRSFFLTDRTRGSGFSRQAQSGSSDLG